MMDANTIFSSIIILLMVLFKFILTYKRKNEIQWESHLYSPCLVRSVKHLFSLSPPLSLSLSHSSFSISLSISSSHFLFCFFLLTYCYIDFLFPFFLFPFLFIFLFPFLLLPLWSPYFTFPSKILPDKPLVNSPLFF